MMRAVVGQMREHGFAPNYRRAIVEGLDTSPEARWARAEAQGFEPNWYHSSLEDLHQFQPTGKFHGRIDAGISLTDQPEVANIMLQRYGDTRWDGQPFQKNVMSLWVRPGKKAGPYGGRSSANPLMGQPLPPGYIPNFVRNGHDAYSEMDNVALRDTPWFPEHNGVQVAHVNFDDPDAIQHEEMLVHDPSRVRSDQAMFNPKRTHKRDILAALALALASQLRANQSDDTMQSME